MVRTKRLVLRPFTDADRGPFAELNAHPLVVEWLGSPATRVESDAMIDRYTAELAREGWSFWAVEVVDGPPFVGMVGLHRAPADLPCAPAVETGWRLHPDHWGHGYAAEAASASVRFGFDVAGLDEIVAFTAATNVRSCAVMTRIGMTHDPSGDFDHPRLPLRQPAAPPRDVPDHPVTAAPYGDTVSEGRRASGEAVRRCDWATGDGEMQAYHDTEWGVPVHDDRTHFEFLVLEGAQAGLSWATVLKRRDGYRKAFAGFDAAKVARFTPARVDALLTDPGIIRNRAKVEATVRNARAFLAVQEEMGSFDAYIWGFVGGSPKVNRWRRTAQLPAVSTESEALSKDLRRRGFGFVGPTIVYAHLQAAGLVNDHLVGCFRHDEVAAAR